MASSGLKYATGTITITTQTNTPPIVTHNLGTKKVFALWWAESGTVYNSYNRIGYQSMINWWDIVPDDYSLTVNNTTDITLDKTAVIPQGDIYAASSKIQSFAYNVNPTAFVKTENTLQLWGGYVRIWAPGTYHWLVVALDDALEE